MPSPPQYCPSAASAHALCECQTPPSPGRVRPGQCFHKHTKPPDCGSCPDSFFHLCGQPCAGPHEFHSDSEAISRAITGAERASMPALKNSALSKPVRDRKSTRLNSSHVASSYAVSRLKKKTDGKVGRNTNSGDD